MALLEVLMPAACFAALLGEEKHGFWRLLPVDEIRSSRRHYRPDTLVLETEFETTNGGCVRLIDCMPPRTDHPHVIRLVEGVQGNVRMRMCLVIRFEYGSIVPWIRERAEPGEFRAIAGPGAIVLRSHIETRGENLATVAEFEVAAGEKIPFVLSWHFSHQPPPPAIDAEGQIASTEEWWRDRLLRAVAGDPAELQILYGVLGERRLTEYELADLPGYEGSKPVRVGNAAAGQYQLDIYGEVVDTFFRARSVGLADGPDGIDWSVPKKLLNFLESNWFKPDEGIWEVRGPRQQFTYSKVMAWVAVDRVIRLAERFHLPADLTKWKSMRQAIHHDVCEKGFNPTIQAFTQCYGSTKLDASILRLPLVGFLESEDPRIGSTIKAVERELLSDGFVRRYVTDSSGSVDGFPDSEGAFLPCTFWLADNYYLIGRHEEAWDMFERLLSLRNDLDCYPRNMTRAIGG